MRSLPIVAGLVSGAVAQQSGWQSDQVNATMCMWEQPRGLSSHHPVGNLELTVAAALLKDTVYIDGGSLYWIPGMADGSYGAATSDGRSATGHFLSLRFC
jgi:hypothetical protein